MPEYRRYYVPGGTYFFTVVTANRAPILTKPLGIKLIHQSFAEAQHRWPFDLDARVILPDHIHSIWILPEGDSEFSSRWAYIKKYFTKQWLSLGGMEQPVSFSQKKNRRKGVWQRRFWEHTIRDEKDYERHCDYIYYNPVKHGLVKCPHEWIHSTFKSAVRRNYYTTDWLCVCNNKSIKEPCFDDLATTAME